jgi:hypothetical protein
MSSLWVTWHPTPIANGLLSAGQSPEPLLMMETPLRTRGLARVRQHADLVMIARLGQALVRARAVRLAA